MGSAGCHPLSPSSRHLPGAGQPLHVQSDGGQDWCGTQASPGLSGITALMSEGVELWLQEGTGGQ